MSESVEQKRKAKKIFYQCLPMGYQKMNVLIAGFIFLMLVWEKMKSTPHNRMCNMNNVLIVCDCLLDLATSA